MRVDHSSTSKSTNHPQKSSQKQFFPLKVHLLMLSLLHSSHLRFILFYYFFFNFKRSPQRQHELCVLKRILFSQFFCVSFFRCGFDSFNSFAFFIVCCVFWVFIYGLIMGNFYYAWSTMFVALWASI